MLRVTCIQNVAFSLLPTLSFIADAEEWDNAIISIGKRHAESATAPFNVHNRVARDINKREAACGQCCQLMKVIERVNALMKDCKNIFLRILYQAAIGVLKKVLDNKCD